MKTATSVFVLSVLSFGQTVSDAQRQACSDVQDAVIENYSNSNLSEKDLRRLIVNLQQICGVADDSQPIVDIHKVITECARTLIRFHKADLTKLPMDEFDALRDSVSHDCRVHPVAHDVTTTKDASSTSENETAKLTTSDIHELLAQSSTALNREIALGNRMIAHLKQAQTWEGVDADHPDAVALCEKIVREEKEFASALRLGSELNDKIDSHQVEKECSKEERDRWLDLMTEATGVMHDARTQQDRYHALGY